jgi:hypothetical protein
MQVVGWTEGRSIGALLARSFVRWHVRSWPELTAPTGSAAMILLEAEQLRCFDGVVVW